MEAARVASVVPRGVESRARRGRIALLSLFDGMGTARLGVEDVLRHAGQMDALAATGCVELDAGLSGAVER
eukprot:2612997-Alexandrium_andersonii.AAC.1